MKTQQEVEDFIYHSYLRARPYLNHEEDEYVRKPQFTRTLLDEIGAPDQGQNIILVTGSKGKGSTSRFISSLLSYHGYKVGLFTSPHLVDFKERIRIDGKAIDKADFINYAQKIKASVEKIEQSLQPSEYQGPVGVTLAIALLHFQAKQTDFNVIECGRGGAFDDTNVLLNEWAVITPIMEEHMKQLGPTLSNIVRHKLGIVKKETNFVYVNNQRIDVLRQIKEVMTREHVNYSGTHFSVDNISLSPEGTTFDVNTKLGRYANITVPLLGEYHTRNAALAVALCEDIVKKKLDLSTVHECFSNIIWPGRCEVVGQNPVILLDGAIHREAAIYLQGVMDVLKEKKDLDVISIVSVPKDKDYKGVMEVVSRFSKMLIVTTPDKSHLEFPTEAVDYAKTLLPNSIDCSSLEEAFAFVTTKEQTDIVLVVGTQTFIGNAKRLLGQSLLDIGR
ncbi:Mur ligase family protein [Alkalihalobacillus sp. LMS39]|uniref:bifunctional folylpolyglutamate synthase/dihydrofolate synthase n=1 Tax=Alkalihalobacillus sp. LMS39 TaxID=2924032 RepID=UPI001FB30FAD|nr:Mur ligase family protein [Alkalihalobacillus sp. LMS39]UOE93598.1 Mur ligase family protein [Alkalihalobacillus sp. LMS39]